MMNPMAHSCTRARHADHIRVLPMPICMSSLMMAAAATLHAQRQNKTPGVDVVGAVHGRTSLSRVRSVSRPASSISVRVARPSGGRCRMRMIAMRARPRPP